MILALAALTAMTYDFAPLTERIESWIGSGYYKGASVRVVRHGVAIYSNSFGDSSADKLELIASSGKWLAAAAIAAVVDEGRLKWDDRVDRYLPEFTDGKGSATLRQLLSHTSGFPDYQPSDRHVDDYSSLEESVSHIVDLPATTRPGERFQYGGLAMQVAGRMAEIATRQSWEEIFEKKIAAPLGMVHTGFLPIDKSGGHSPKLGGGAHSTLSDYSRFLEMILHDGLFRGRRVLSHQAIQEMQADQVGAAVMSDERYVARSAGELHNGVYGLGEWREALDDRGRATIITSPSWAGALPWIDKRRDLYGFFIAHVDTAGPASREGFNSFYSAPFVLDTVKRVVDRADQHIRTGVVGGLRYEEAGIGEPVILLHAHGVDRRMWDSQFRLLAKSHRVIRYDLRGYGESAAPVEFADFTHADDLLALMEGLRIHKAHLVGLSLGSLTAVDFLALHPERVLSLVAAAGAIHDAAGIDSETLAQRSQRHESDLKDKVQVRDNIRSKGLGWYREEYLRAIESASAPRSGIRYRLWRMVDDWSVWQKTHIEGYPLLDLSVSALLKQKKPTIPILLIVGDYDSRGSKESSARLAAILPQAKTVHLATSGHFSNLEDPDGFDRALEDFFHLSR
jgi:CubicO group peptidase (beta-lactamase class C family)/pimeloyl-ACP methyl ester carboxylesterase